MVGLVKCFSLPQHEVGDSGVVQDNNLQTNSSKHLKHHLPSKPSFRSKAFKFRSVSFSLSIYHPQFDFAPLLGLAMRRKVCFAVWFCSVARLDCEKKRLCDYKVMARVPDKIKLIDGSRELLSFL
ncbi:hypothetical protein GYH30_024596 [Glycine max]|uniref:Uncharacterized protein n=1 Tax=Glycine max TaxID=3847 RepID=A0A0R0I6I1_SOYBN|nr:hypothetical protein GYH30_024596 [Glycine max]